MSVRSITDKPSPWLRESADPEVFEALRRLRALPVKVTTLDCQESQGFYVFRFLVLPGIVANCDPLGERILVTKSFERYARLFSELYRERRALRLERKPISTSNSQLRKTHREAVCRS
jgi:hypothetical protein